MTKPRTCPVCKVTGPPDHRQMHADLCTAALRSLVGAALAWNETFSAPHSVTFLIPKDMALSRACDRFRRGGKKRP
jgi:hypothetical protein